MKTYVVGQVPSGYAPLPPENVLINGARYPADISGQYTISWAPNPREHVHGPAASGDETYTLRLYDETDTLHRTVTGITGNSYTWGTEVADSVLDYSQEVPADNPISYWKLGETSGTQAVDSAGSNHGTYTGGVTLNQASIPGSATPSVLLNGSSGYVDCGAPASLNITSAWTLEAWVYLTSTPNGVGVISEAISPDSKILYELGFGNDGGGSALTIGYYTGSYYAESKYTTPLSLNAWHQCVGTWDGANLSLYLDGAQVVTGVKSPGPSSSMSQLFLGRFHDTGYNEYFPGRMAHAAIYPTALSAIRIAAHYNASVNPPRYNSSIRAELETVRGGVTSYQKQVIKTLRSVTTP